MGGVVSEKTSCPKCGGSIERRPGPGRTAVYCGPICRGLAGYEVRRLQRRLQALEGRLSWLRHKPEDDHLDARQQRYAAQRRVVEIEGVEAEIAEAEARLSLLVSETRGTMLALLHERSDK